MRMVTFCGPTDLKIQFAVVWASIYILWGLLGSLSLLAGWPRTWLLRPFGPLGFVHPSGWLAMRSALTSFGASWGLCPFWPVGRALGSYALLALLGSSTLLPGWPRALPLHPLGPLGFFVG